MAMWLQIVALVHFYFQATCCARSLDTLDTSVVLERLISSSTRNHHPIIIVVNPPKNLLPDFENDDTTNERYKDENFIQQISSLRSHNHNVESCKQFLRQKLNAKCSKEANCSEVVWDIADHVCKDADDEKQTVDKDDGKIKYKEVKVESKSTPRKSRTSTRAPRDHPKKNH